MAVSLDKLGTKLTDIIEGYAIEVQEDVLKRFDLTADEILNYVKTNCPRSNSGSLHLADTFVKTEVGTGVNKIIYISSQEKGRLVHLIELGFKHKSGKHVEAQPFMRPAYDTFTPEMLEDIKKIIKGGNA